MYFHVVEQEARGEAVADADKASVGGDELKVLGSSGHLAGR